MARCVFCLEKATSKEHAIPKWIPKRLGIKAFMAPDEAIHHGVVPRKHPISFKSHRKRMVCQECQDYLKELEDEVIPLLEPMAKGRIVGLGDESRELLARWAFGRATALLALVPEFATLVPDEHRFAFRQSGRVCDEIWIGYFPWRGGPVISTGLGTAVGKVNPTPRYETYGVIVTFGDIGFSVIGFLDPISVEEEINGELWPSLQFWPRTTRMIVWPPEGEPFRPGEGMSDLLNFMPVRTLPKQP